MSASAPEGWQRLHPLSPVVRGGRATIAIFVLLIPIAVGADTLRNATPQIVVIGVLALGGFVSWLVTRWRIEGDDLRIETGLLRRQSLRFPLAQVQAIDVVRPGLARVFRVAELRLRMAGASGATARLAYLAEHEVEPLRDQLLALARGARLDEVASAPGEEEGADRAKEHILATVATGPLVAAIVLENLWVVAVLAGLLVGFTVSPRTVAGLLGGGGFVWALSMVTVVWRRFNQQYRLTVAEGPEGLHLRGGLVALTAEVIRPGRVQAVRLVEPVLWRPLGWCRLEVDVAGRQRRKGEGEAQRGQLRTLLPVGKRALAVELVDRLVPDRPRELSRPPRRVLWKSPFRYPALSWGRTETCVVTTSGRLRRVTCWVALEKVQSLRRVQGPVQRRLRLASVHVDTAGRAVHTTLRDRDSAEAAAALAELTDLARAARRKPALA
ncbi:MAG TPA: PH domain-containing protein [Gaiellaceae bacterium]|nr:PH domain-containing protein [Gaiellaceae bacterium]